MFRFVYKDIDFSHKFDAVVPPNAETVMHSHNFFEIYYFLKGEVDFTVEKISRRLEPDDVIIIAPGSHHLRTIAPDKPYERYVLRFPLTFVPKRLQNDLLRSNAFLLGNERLKSYFENLDLYYDTYSLDSENAYILMTSSLCIILVCILNASKTPQVQPMPSSIVAKIIDYVNENIMKPMDMQTLSKEFNYSQS